MYNLLDGAPAGAGAFAAWVRVDIPRCKRAWVCEAPTCNSPPSSSAIYHQVRPRLLLRLHHSVGNPKNELPELPIGSLTRGEERFLQKSRLLRSMLVGELLVTCTNDGCDATPKYSELVSHEEECDHGAGECEHCEERFPRSSLAAHELACPERPITCKKGCGATLPHSAFTKGGGGAHAAGCIAYMTKKIVHLEAAARQDASEKRTIRQARDYWKHFASSMPLAATEELDLKWTSSLSIIVIAAVRHEIYRYFPLMVGGDIGGLRTWESVAARVSLA